MISILASPVKVYTYQIIYIRFLFFLLKLFISFGPFPWYYLNFRDHCRKQNFKNGFQNKECDKKCNKNQNLAILLECRFFEGNISAFTSSHVNPVPNISLEFKYYEFCQPPPPQKKKNQSIIILNIMFFYSWFLPCFL